MDWENEEHFHSLYTDDEIEMAAKVGHSVMQAVNDAFNLPKLPQWELCYPWYKAKIIASVEEILYSARSCRNMHTRWVRRMLARGWVLGEHNRELKQHPHLKEFNDLPIEVRMRSKLFRAAIMPFRKESGKIKHESNRSADVAGTSSDE